MKKPYLPILIDIERLDILIVGGGAVATRKTASLSDFGAKITVLSPAVTPELLKLHNEGKINIIFRKYETGDCHNFGLIFAATGDPEADMSIKSDCDSAGILLNVADVPELCSFIMPAIIKRGSLTVSIASQGTAPFFVKHLRERIEKDLDPDIEIISSLAARFRSMVLEKQLDPETNKKLFSDFLSQPWESIIPKKRPQELESFLNSLIEGYPE